MSNTTMTLSSDGRISSILVLSLGSVSIVATTAMVGLYLFRSNYRALRTLENSLYAIAVIFMLISTSMKVIAAGLLLAGSMAQEMCDVLGATSILFYGSGVAMGALFFVFIIVRLRRWVCCLSLRAEMRTRVVLSLCTASTLVYTTTSTVLASIRWNRGQRGAHLYTEVYGFCGSRQANKPLLVPVIFIPFALLILASIGAYVSFIAQRGMSTWRRLSVHIRCLGLNAVLLISVLVGELTGKSSYVVTVATSTYAAFLAGIFWLSERESLLPRSDGAPGDFGFTRSLEDLIAAELKGEPSPQLLSPSHEASALRGSP